jgi:phosphoesterase RecJ-like protein
MALTRIMAAETPDDVAIPTGVERVADHHAASIRSLLELIAAHQTFVVTSHSRPDGDAIGSALGMMHLLDAMGKDVTVSFADDIPATYTWLPGAERIQATLPDRPDVAIVLECDRIERTGYSVEQFQTMNAGLMVNIDHHLSGRAYADVNWIDVKACAVGAMIYHLAVASGLPIGSAKASCLYTAVLTDTGGFTYPGTDASTFALAEHLVQCGADSTAIARKVYFSNTVGKIRALGEALCTMQIDRGVAWAWITEKQMDHAGASVEDCEGIVNYLIGIAEVEVAVFLRELQCDSTDNVTYRLSLRSKGKVDVAAVASRFGGGGHREASGCTLEGPLESAIERITAEMAASLPK